MDVITLTQKLLSFDNTNPPGNEEGIALFVGDLLSDNGFTTEYYYFDEKRVHLVAERGLSDSRPPLVLSGHFDTVPLGNTPWNTDPFTGEVKDGKIRGRGASDMKGALAAMIISSIVSFWRDTPEGGIRIIYSAAEELGCIGIQASCKDLKDSTDCMAIIIGEPTSNRPLQVIGCSLSYKLCLRAVQHTLQCLNWVTMLFIKLQKQC
jgi:succinyl-diaminopimelate desuccinylase